MVGDIVPVHRRVADVAQVVLDVAGGGDAREQRAGPVGRDDPDPDLVDEQAQAVQAIGPPTEMCCELTGYRRPAWLASRTTMAQADIAGTLTFDPVPGGTRMRWAWVVRPKGTSRLLTPVISRIGRRQERAIWTGMRRYLEAQPRLGGITNGTDTDIRR